MFKSITTTSSGARAGISLLAVVATALSLLVLVTPVAANGNGPRGNNGTVKLDRNDFDTHPNNQPHVGCIFQVDFYGFDQGDLWAGVTFEVHPPTGNNVILTDSVFIGEDDNAGGGSEAGLDAQRTYDLTSVLQGYIPHPNQGYHVKLTVNADGSQGADTKHKVFWVEGCAAVVTEPPVETEPPVVTEPPTVIQTPVMTEGPNGTNPPTGGELGSTRRPRASSIPNTAADMEMHIGSMVTLLSVLVVIGSLGWLGAAQLKRSGTQER